MSVPTVYRWDDVDAPFFSNDKSPALFFKACLVDGYGDKPGAGWSLLFESDDSETIVVSNTAGSGCCLKITKPSISMIGLQAFEFMTSIDTGINPITDVITFRICSAMLENNGSKNPWMIIADDRGFYFIACKTPRRYLDSQPDFEVAQKEETVEPIYFGDIVPVRADDVFNSCSFVGQGCFAWASVRSLGIAKSARSVSGEVGAIDCYLNLTGGFDGDICFGSGALPNYTTSCCCASKPYLNMGDMASIRGYLPGLYYPWHNAASMPFWKEIEIGGAVFMSINTAVTAHLIQVDEWDRGGAVL